MSNPNVLIELGYASSKLGWDRILCIHNLMYGKIEDLPLILGIESLLHILLKAKH